MNLIQAIRVVIIWFNGMRTLSDLVQRLAFGELKGTPFVETGSFEIQKKNLPTLITYINDAQSTLYTQFPIKSEQVVIQMTPSRNTYSLDDRFAVTNRDGNPNKYILDNPEKPFDESTLVKISGITSIDGLPYPINDYHNVRSIHLVDYNTIEINFPYRYSDKLVVVYQAKPKDFNLDYEISKFNRLEVPPMYEQAFRALIACLALKNMGGGKHNESNAFWAIYQTQCELLRAEGIDSKDYGSINVRPKLNGWI